MAHRRAMGPFVFRPGGSTALFPAWYTFAYLTGGLDGRDRQALSVARADLKAARARLRAEITAYPTPISACDAQFNHLLAQRRRIGAALAALKADIFIPTPRRPDPGAWPESR